MEETKKYITSIKNFLGEKVSSILEIQCGGGYDIENCKALQDSNLRYIGVDVVDEVIRDNRQYFRDEKNKLFMILDASNEPLPQCDLVICSGMMEYLPIANIWALIENIRNSGAEYVAFDYYHSKINNIDINKDIVLDSKTKNFKNRAINLTMSPFYFPQPEIIFPTEDINRSLCLYKIKDIVLYMEWHNDNISLLRKELLPQLEDKIKKIENAFLKYENGKEMLDNILTDENNFSWSGLDWNKVYYDEKYKKIVDENGIFEDYICLALLLFKTSNSNDQKRVLDNYKITIEIDEEDFVWITILARDFILYKYGELTF